jgi:protein-tyrosine phosphatase
VLFVCLGNICRSPLAKAVFTDAARRRSVDHLFDIDSCGTGHWHAGEGADRRAIHAAANHGLTLIHTARQLEPTSDFVRFQLVVAMDRENRKSLLARGAAPERVRLMRSFDGRLTGDHDVPDPYYGTGDGFETVFQMLTTACEGLLDQLLSSQSGIA